MLLLQFIVIFNKQRNTDLRRKLLAIIAKTNFDKNMDELKKFIMTIKNPDDAIKLKNIIGRFVTAHHNRKTLLDDLTTTYFDFDQVELQLMKSLPHDQIISKLQDIAKAFVVIGDIEKLKPNFVFPNMLIACGGTKTTSTADYCTENKFIITQSDLDTMLDLLATDIKNEMKVKWLFNSLFISRSVNFFKFIRRPNETITCSVMA